MSNVGAERVRGVRAWDRELYLMGVVALVRSMLLKVMLRSVCCAYVWQLTVPVVV